MQTAHLLEGKVRAHAHHKSKSSDTPEPYSHGTCIRQRSSYPGEAVFREGSLTATYLHLFFPSNAEAVARLFGAANEVE